MTTRFLSNESLWSELRSRVKHAKSVKAAVAFVGAGGADLLPLKRGDTLVVNLGMNTVEQGLTTPKEIQRLLRRGVRVFTRSTLHAKFFLCDRTLITGSANISRNSYNTLDEAASVTTDALAIRRASDFFESLCTEPVRPEYLKRCLKAYRPPSFSQNGTSKSGPKQTRIVEAKLWFIGGLRYGRLPDDEIQTAERIERQTAKRLQKSQGTSVDYTHYPRKPKYFSQIRVGDWVINCIADSEGNRFVHAPQQVLGQEAYPRARGKKRYLLLSEASDRGQEMRLTEFRRKVRHNIPKLDTPTPRTTPIESVESADSILRMWTVGGRIARKTNRSV